MKRVLKALGVYLVSGLVFVDTLVFMKALKRVKKYGKDTETVIKIKPFKALLVMLFYPYFLLKTAYEMYMNKK